MNKESTVRHACRIVGTIFTCLLLIAFSNSVLGADRPNIVFLLADDLGYGDLGSYGGEVIATPHLDQLAREGMRFTQAYAGGPVCTSSRSVLMTGLHGGHTPARDNIPHYHTYLQEKDITIAEVLKGGGYRCGGVGKWSLGDAGTVDESFTRVLGNTSDIHDLTFASDGLPILLGEFPDIKHSETSHLLKFTSDDPSQTMIHFADTFYRAFESDGFVHLSLDRMGDVSRASEVSIRLMESDSMEDQDFFKTHHIGKFDPLAHQTIVSIPVQDDVLTELDETVSIEMTPLTHWIEMNRETAVANTIDLHDVETGNVRYYRVRRH